MKRFRYRLDALLTLRKSQTTKCLEIYGNVLHARQQYEMALENALSKQESIADTLKELRSGGFSVGSQEMYMKGLEENLVWIKDIKEKIQEIGIEERKALEQLVEAKKRENIFEKLKEKQWLQYLKDSIKVEDQMLEEFSRTRKQRA